MRLKRDRPTWNWLWHNWAVDIGNKGLPQYTNAVSSEYGAATGIADFCNKAQLLNLETQKGMFEGWLDHSDQNAAG